MYTLVSWIARTAIFHTQTDTCNFMTLKSNKYKPVKRGGGVRCCCRYQNVLLHERYMPLREHGTVMCFPSFVSFSEMCRVQKSQSASDWLLIGNTRGRTAAFQCATKGILSSVPFVFCHLWVLHSYFRPCVVVANKLQRAIKKMVSSVRGGVPHVRENARTLQVSVFSLFCWDENLLSSGWTR